MPGAEIASASKTNGANSSRLESGVARAFHRPRLEQGRVGEGQGTFVTIRTAPDFAEGNTEAQEGRETCLRVHSQWP